MERSRWLRLTAACACACLSQNQLYRRAALGEVRTRQATDGKTEFLVEDLKRLRDDREDNVRGR